MNQSQSDFVLLFGHSHPLLVHLPIGFLVLLVVMELLAKRPRFEKLSHASGLVLVLALVSSAFSAACGWALASKGEYDLSLINIHRWTGVGVAAACFVTAIFYWRRWIVLYNIGLFTTFALVIVAGHFGGSLTHGSDFLTKHLPASIRQLLGEPAPRPPIADPEQAIAWADLVQPILQSKCVACHGPSKQQGKLRLDIAANAAKSKMLTAITLPLDHKEHMPPVGKPQLTDDEITLLRWWVNAGVSADKKVADLKPTARVYAVFDKMFGQPAAVAPPKSLDELKPVIAGFSGVLIQPLAAGQPWLDVNASLVGKKFTDADLAKLVPLAGNIRRLDLGGTGVTDASLAAIAGMPHVERLDLHQTTVTDAGMEKLKSLRKLEYLNLYGTGITDAALPHLKRLVNLRRLYLWQTKVTPAAGQALANELEDKERIARLERDIQALKTEISREQVEVNLGNESPAAAVAKPINTVCPILGKPVDPTKTFVYQGKLIGFCCDKCCAEFAKNPKKYVATLGLK
jgi:uncharacterized membrane protein/mono/diheme cytochrome c family protein/YHS domain-containing protein